MARNERLLPGRQLGVRVGQRRLRLLLKFRDLVRDLRTLAVGLEGLQLRNLVFEFEDGLLEVEYVRNAVVALTEIWPS